MPMESEEEEGHVSFDLFLQQLDHTRLCRGGSNDNLNNQSVGATFFWPGGLDWTMIGEEDDGEDEQLLTMMSTEELRSVLRKRNKEKQEVERQFVDLKAKVNGLLEIQTRRKEKSRQHDLQAILDQGMGEGHLDAPRMSLQNISAVLEKSLDKSHDVQGG